MDATLQQKLGETLHFFAADAGEVQGSWDAQKDDYKQKMLVLAQRVDKALTTLNQTVVRIDAPIVPASFEQTTLPHMITFMQTFIKEKVKHPKGVAELFPTEELAKQIILEFGYKKPVPSAEQPCTLPDGTPGVAFKEKRPPTAAQLAWRNRGKKEPANV